MVPTDCKQVGSKKTGKLDHEIQVKIKHFLEKDGGGFIFILTSERLKPKVNVLIL